MPGEKPVLGLRVGEEVSPVRDIKNLYYILTQVTERKTTDIDGICRDLAEVVKAELPIEFLFETGLTEYKWQQIYHPNALSAVYLGTGEQDSISFTNSEALIVICSKIADGQVCGDTVEISAVVPDSQARRRVLNASWYANSLVVNRGAVSIGDDEIPQFPSDINPNYPIETERRLVKIPTLLQGVVWIPKTPLVSLRMTELTNGDSRMVIEYSNSDGYYFMKFPGYFGDLEGANRFIGRGTKSEPLWEISYPAQLTPQNK